jgi:hypothetical protein
MLVRPGMASACGNYHLCCSRAAAILIDFPRLKQCTVGRVIDLAFPERCLFLPAHPVKQGEQAVRSREQFPAPCCDAFQRMYHWQHSVAPFGSSLYCIRRRRSGYTANRFHHFPDCTGAAYMQLEPGAIPVDNRINPAGPDSGKHAQASGRLVSQVNV